MKLKKIQLTLYTLAAVTLSIFYHPLYASLDPIERAKQIAQAAKLALYLPYNLTQLYILQNNPQQKAYKQALKALRQPFPPAKKTYQELNAHPESPFLVSIGTAMSQTEFTDNIIHPEYLAELLQKKSQTDKNPRSWLTQRWGYVIRSVCDIQCNQCNTATNLASLQQDDPLVTTIVKNFSLNKNTNRLQLSACPYCQSVNIMQRPQTIAPLTKEDKKAIKEQLESLGVLSQAAACHIPGCRISGELANLLDNDGNIILEKLQEQVRFAQDLQHPLWVFHHYANPKCKPYLFEQKDDIAWFADKCAQFIQACPGLTHVCPISQIMGFGMQVSRQKMLPPFSCDISTDQFLQNIVQAQIAASKAMKKINPHLKVLVSHQWKPMKPIHSLGDPRHALECAVCTIADRMYNQKFAQLLKPHTDSFDGIALSIYPALYFDTVTPCGNNCTGMIDPQAALEAIVQTNLAFPDKEIHIVETGCNSNDPETKKQFVDMTLYVCKLAQDLGIPVKSCYFWGHANNPYFEWNKNPGTSFFGPFESLEIDSINEYGKYLQEILK